MNLRITSKLVLLLALGGAGMFSFQTPTALSQQPEATQEPLPEATAEPTAVNAYPGAEETEAGGLRFLLPGEVANAAVESFVEAVPVDPNTIFSAAVPAHMRIDFVDYLPDDAPEITHDFRVEPVIQVFNIADFADYVTPGGEGYPSELSLLQGIIDGTIRREPNTPLPRLPFVNAAQVFHSREQVIRFNGGWGLVYLTSYAQDVYPVLEGEVQLIFQGITDDGLTYISAVLPVDTGILPDELAEDFDFEAFVANYEDHLSQTRQDLEAQPADAFAPNLAALLALVGSIEVIQP